MTCTIDLNYYVVTNISGKIKMGTHVFKVLILPTEACFAILQSELRMFMHVVQDNIISTSLQMIPLYILYSYECTQMFL